MKHKIAAVGDSIMQGFVNGALHQTEYSIPSIIAGSLGVGDRFCQPQPNPEFDSLGGIPFNLEYLLRWLSTRLQKLGMGKHINWFNSPVAMLLIKRYLDRIERHWQKAKMPIVDVSSSFYHNLGVISFTTADIATINSHFCNKALDCSPSSKGFHFVKELLEWPVYRVARHILNPKQETVNEKNTILDCLSQVAGDGGVENLLLYLGTNQDS